MSIEKEFRDLDKKLKELKPKHDKAVEEIAKVCAGADKYIEYLKTVADIAETEIETQFKAVKKGYIIAIGVGILSFTIGALLGAMIW